MLIELTIKNFRSIKDEQTFSLYAGEFGQKNVEMIDNVVYLPREEDGAMGVLKVAALYGANASGKSNVLSALFCLQAITKSSADLKEVAKFERYYDPYRLCEQTKHAPTCFELEFFCKMPKGAFSDVEVGQMVRFIYKIEFNRERVVSESLDCFPKRSKASLFQREENDTWETIKFGSYYKGGNKRIPFFLNNSYLSKAGDYAGAPDVVRAVYNYLTGKVHCLGVNTNIELRGLHKKSDVLKLTAQILGEVDTGVQGVEYREKELDSKRLQMLDEFLSDKSFPDAIKENIKQEMLAPEPYFKHMTEEGGVEYFAKDNLSAGTQRLFGFIPVISRIFRHGETLVFDELESQFHPHVAQLIIRLFNDARVNQNGGQLIFTTHSTEIMESKLLRRDQVWFTEKEMGATTLYSLDDFDKNRIRPDSPYAKWYKEGRFGAVPRLDYLSIADMFVAAVQNERLNDGVGE